MKAQKNRPAGAVSKDKPLPSITEMDVMSSAILALKAEAVENGSARLTVFYTDGEAIDYTTGHSQRRRRKGGIHGK